MSDLVENIENMDVNAIRDKADKDMLENVEKMISDLDLDCKQEELQNRNKSKNKNKGSEEEAEAVEVQKDQEKLAANDVAEEKTESEEETQDNSSGDSSTTSDGCSAEGEEGCSVEEKSKEESKIEAEKDEQKKTDGHGLDAGILTDRLNKSAAVQVKLTGNETDLANYSQDKTVNAPPSTPVVMTADELKPLVDGSTTAADEKQKMEHLRGGADKEEEDSSMHTAASPDPLLKQSNKEGSDADRGEKNDNMQNPADNLDEKKKSVCSIC